MKLCKSIVLSGILPQVKEDRQAFERGVDYFSKKGITVFEYFAPFQHTAEFGRILKERSLRSIYLAAIYQKMYGLNLSAVDENERAKAVEQVFDCIDAAIAAEADSVLVTSGAYPKDASLEPKALDALERSLCELFDHAGNAVKFLLEPGDQFADSRQFMGPTDKAVELTKRLRERYQNISLTLDTSHMALMGEDIKASIELAKPYCGHIHLANCIINKALPLYGDKHPFFNCADSAFTSADLKEIMQWAAKLYSNDELTITVEIISRSEDPWADAEHMLEEENWFFEG